MPLFWKKGPASAKSNSPKASPEKRSQIGNVPNGEVGTRPKAVSTQQQRPCLEDLVDLGPYGSNFLAVGKSRLSQNLEQVIEDHSSLTHFIQFLDCLDQVHLVQFWLDAESFRASACTRLGGSQARKLSLNLPNPRVELTEKLLKSIEEDAVNIFSKYIAKDATHPVGVSDAIRDEVTGRICGEDRLVDPECFRPAQKFIMLRLENEYFPDFMRSVHYCKHQISVLTSGKLTLEDVIYNETALFYFMEFMEQEGHRHLLEFWMMADNFSRQLTNQESYNATQAQDDAMVLYDKYFSLQATCPLGFGDRIRFKVEEGICREGGPLPTCFHEPTRYVMAALAKNHFPHFLGSQMFFKYLSDLVNAVQSNHFTRERKYSGSDAGSEHSQGSRAGAELLLAKDDLKSNSHGKQFVQRFRAKDMQIDTGQFNPDALWRRPYSGKLNVGHVNELGQFITDFEPEPDRRSGESILTKAVKRLVHKEDDKEELAIQIAQMVIQEVTSITMTDHVDRSPSTSSGGTS